MFISPIMNSPKASNANLLQNYSSHKNIHGKNYGNSISFSGKTLSPEVLKNQLRILLSQDIWAEKLNVKMPETEMEKEVLLEILRQRIPLDKFARLSNEKARITWNVNFLRELLEKDPMNPQISVICQELKKYGDLTKTIETICKKLHFEQKKNKAALEYFKALQKLEDEYISSKLIKNHALAQFWAQVKKHNINAEQKFSTEELIDIISKSEVSGKTKEAAKTKPVVSVTRKQILASMQKQYEQYLRENVNIYMGEHHWKEAVKGRKELLERNLTVLRRFPDLDKQLNKMFDSVQKKYSFKTNCLGEADIYPIGEIWKELTKGIGEIKDKISEIESLKSKLSVSDDAKLKSALEKAEEELAELKKDWADNLSYSIKFEKANRAAFIKIGTLDNYDYLTAENKEILRYKELANLCDKNTGLLPESVWKELLA